MVNGHLYDGRCAGGLTGSSSDSSEPTVAMPRTCDEEEGVHGGLMHTVELACREELVSPGTRHMLILAARMGWLQAGEAGHSRQSWVGIP